MDKITIITDNTNITYANTIHVTDLESNDSLILISDKIKDTIKNRLANRPSQLIIHSDNLEFRKVAEDYREKYRILGMEFLEAFEEGVSFTMDTIILPNKFLSPAFLELPVLGMIYYLKPHPALEK